MNENNKDSKFLDAIYKHAEEEKAQLRQDIRNYKKSKIKAPKKHPEFHSTSRESKFFDAINQDAELHIAQITREIEEYKSEKIEQATEQGLNDAYNLIQADVTKRTAAIVNEVAKKQLELKNRLYAERQAIRDEVFREAEEKLRTFTQSEDYPAFLGRSAKEIADAFGSEHCIVYLSPADLSRCEEIAQTIKDAEVVTDKRILIGGIKAFCPAKGILLDDTLDTRLSDQYAWFNENSGLKVV